MACLAQAARVPKIEARADETESWWPSAEFAVLQKVYDDCSSTAEITMCLKSKALNALSRAVDQVFIQYIKNPLHFNFKNLV